MLLLLLLDPAGSRHHGGPHRHGGQKAKDSREAYRKLRRRAAMLLGQGREGAGVGQGQGGGEYMWQGHRGGEYKWQGQGGGE